jgi:hypothetical protein
MRSMDGVDHALSGLPSPSAPKQKKRFRVWPWLLVGLLLLVGKCGLAMFSGKQDGDAAVQRIHQQLAAGDCAAVFSGASAKYRAAMSEAGHLKFCNGVLKVLGKPGESKFGGFQVVSNTGGTTVSMQVTTTFEKGEAKEAFVFLREDDGLKLLSYNVNSPLFIPE